MACKKLAFKTPEAAERTRAIMHAQGVTGKKGHSPARLYLCPYCELWHWTAQEESHDGAPSITLPPLPELPKPPPPTQPAKKEEAKPKKDPEEGFRKTARLNEHISKLRETDLRKIAMLEEALQQSKELLRVACAQLHAVQDRDSIELAVSVMNAVVALPKQGLHKGSDFLTDRIEEKLEWFRQQRETDKPKEG